jgi:DUF1680 family protein
MGKKPVQIIQQNNYPWDGDLVFKINPKKSAAFSLLFRIPGWARDEAIPSNLYKFEPKPEEKTIIRINGKQVDFLFWHGYAVISRVWNQNDQVEMVLPMGISKVRANENLKDDIGKIALQRGPIIYCAEWIDNMGKTSNIIFPLQTALTPEFRPDLLHGITILKGEVQAVQIGQDNIYTIKQSFTAIPYYSWANRGKGEMTIWFPSRVSDIDLISR